MTINNENLDSIVFLYSGGRDSMLSIKRLIEYNYKDIRILTCQNQHIEDITLARDSMNKLSHKYNPKISAFPLVNSGPIMYDMMSVFANRRNIDCEMSQIICLCCRASMIACAVALAKKSRIHTIGTGDRVNDPYLFNKSEFQKAFDDFCNEHDIQFVRPVFDVESDHNKKVELAEAGIYPKVTEPICWLGYEPTEIPQSSIDTMVKEFNAYIYPLMNKHVERIMKAS